MILLDDSATQRRLRALSSARQLAFALLVCERLMLALQRFGKDTGFEISRYRNGLELAWESLNGSRDTRKYEPASRYCFEGAPDTENFTHPLISDALSAALSISELVGFLADHGVEHIVETIRLARDTAAMRVQAGQPIAVSLDDVMKHDFVQQELRRQEEELSFAESLPDDVAEVARLTKLWASPSSEMTYSGDLQRGPQ
jgi:uncharacterized protein YjaG (DUF416 family)